MSDLVYSQYINSPEWVRRRIEYFAHHNRICRACGKGTNIHLHHLTYERMGRELDRDLMVLCERCHAAVHDFARHKPKLTLEEATFSAIRMMSWERQITRGQKISRRGRRSNLVNGKLAPGLDPEYARRRDARDQHKRDVASR